MSGAGDAAGADEELNAAIQCEPHARTGVMLVHWNPPFLKAFTFAADSMRGQGKKRLTIDARRRIHYGRGQTLRPCHLRRCFFRTA